MSLLNVGARALLANQVALQTTGHNIANVGVAGYSRQSVVMRTMPGQYSGNGWIGKGADVATILRNHDELLTRQAAAAQAAQAGDRTRAERLWQMQDVFSGGNSGMGAALGDIMNALGNVVTTPTDISARTVALTRMDEMAARMRAAAQRLQEQEQTASEQLGTHAKQINHLARSVADINAQIAQAQHRGHTPNDLLDQREQLIREMNQYVQTTTLAADDGSVNLFVGNQALVMGDRAGTVAVGEAALFPGSGHMVLTIQRPGSTSGNTSGNASSSATAVELDEAVLGGGQVQGLLHFVNHDLTESRNQLGRMAQAIALTMNGQQRLGITLDGVRGKDLFSVPSSARGHTSGVAAGRVAVTDATCLSASDYEVRFTTPPAGQVVRLSDGKATAFSSLDDPALHDIDGLAFHLTNAGKAGERVLFQPFAQTAANMHMLIHSPRDLAAANPIHAAMGESNTGELHLGEIKANHAGFTSPDIGQHVQLTFHVGPPCTVTITGSSSPASGSTLPYTPGEPLEIDGWSLILQGAPNEGDSVTIGNALDPEYGDIYTRNAGNAAALRALRDVQMFDGAAMTDGWANLVAHVGTRTQSALYAAQLSESIANHLEADRTAVSGVNLDEEAAKLIQYQQAYQASAKMLQIAQTIFDNLISTIGR